MLAQSIINLTCHPWIFFRWFVQASATPGRGLHDSVQLQRFRQVSLQDLPWPALPGGQRPVLGHTAVCGWCPPAGVISSSWWYQIFFNFLISWNLENKTRTIKYSVSPILSIYFFSLLRLWLTTRQKRWAMQWSQYISIAICIYTEKCSEWI